MGVAYLTVTLFCNLQTAGDQELALGGNSAGERVLGGGAFQA